MELPEISRRVFLSRSLRAMGALATLPLVAPACSGAPRVAVPETLHTFTAGEYAILAAVAETLVPPGGAFPLGAPEAGLAARIDSFLATQDPAAVEGLRGALVLLEYGGGLLAGRIGRFSRMDAEARTAVFSALPHRFGLARQIYIGLKQLCLFLFYCVDASWGAIGYEGPWIGTKTVAP